MSTPQPKIQNDYVAAFVALSLTFLGLYAVGAMVHPYLVGLGDPPVAGSR